MKEYDLSKDALLGTTLRFKYVRFAVELAYVSASHQLTNDCLIKPFVN